MLKNSFVIFIIVSFFIATPFAGAYVASSTNYIIQSDSISYGGGLSTSSSFSMQDTISNMSLGESTSESYTIDSGPLAVKASTISVSTPGDLTLSGSISSLTGGSAEGSVSVTVITDNPGGYQLKIEGTPLSSGSASFDSYSGPASWSVASDSSGFGFSTSTNDVWDSIDTTAKVIYSENANNQPTGTVTTINFKAETKKTLQQQPSGSYSSTITLTAVVR